MLSSASPQGAAPRAEELHGPKLFQQPFTLVKGEGSYLQDEEGNSYLDFMTGIGVASLGHSNKRLTAAVAEQAGRLLVCPQSQGHPLRAKLLKRLTALAGGRLERVFLSNSGTEANEAAIKWALAATGRRVLVAAKRGFAGRTLGALSLTHQPAYRQPFAPLPLEVRFVTFGNEDELIAAVDDEVAAVLLEPVQGEGGVHPAPRGYLALARQLTERKGALLLLDEVQSGAGRSGRFLASHLAGVEADVVTLAKGLAGGVPIGATLMSEQVASAMPPGGHGSTFGGNPLACAAALAVLDELEESDLYGNAAAMGERLMSAIRGLNSRRVREVRGVGLMIGVELRERARAVTASLRRRGLLTVTAGPNVIRLLPPLNVTAAEVNAAVALLEAELCPR